MHCPSTGETACLPNAKDDGAAQPLPSIALLGADVGGGK
jgi:hypothetical protein